MKLRCSVWILWTTLACTTAPNIQQTAPSPALSFVLTPTGVYELEDTLALIWRNNGKPLTNEAFYFSYIIFACTELTVEARQIESASTTDSVTFIYEILQPPEILEVKSHPPFCLLTKKYYASVVSIIRLNDRYVIDSTMKENRNRREFSVGYEVSQAYDKLGGKGLRPLERFDGLAKGSGWLEAYKVIYDIDNLIVRQVSYELNFLGLSEKAPGYCENFELGRVFDFIKVINFAKAYKSNAQIGEKVSLSEVIRPLRPQSQSVKETTGSSSAPKLVQRGLPESKKPRLAMEPEHSQPIDDINDIGRDSNKPTSSTHGSKTECGSSKSTKRSQTRLVPFDHESDEEYMVMQQLAPIEYFDVVSIQWSTCTYLNVVPMWRSLASGPWMRVDQAIRKMLYVIDKLFVIAGTHGVLQLPNRISPNQYQNVFLRSMGKNITIPMLFYKFVIHKVPFPGSGDASLSYGIIIVMHNNFGVPTNRICPDDPANLCYQLGWDVGSEDDEIAKPYCCNPSTKTLNLLDIAPYSSPFRNLDLNRVLLEITDAFESVVKNYNQFKFKEYKVIAKKKAKTKKLNDIYF